jgi:hypothetical protein
LDEPGRLGGQQAEQGVRAGPRRREAFQKLPKRIEFQRRNGVFSDDGPEADRSASSIRTNQFHETPGRGRVPGETNPSHKSKKSGHVAPVGRKGPD